MIGRIIVTAATITAGGKPLKLGRGKGTFAENTPRRRSCLESGGLELEAIWGSGWGGALRGFRRSHSDNPGGACGSRSKE